MVKIIDKRGTGKSSRILLYAKEKDATIVSHFPKAFYDKAKTYGIEGIRAISYEQFLNELPGNTDTLYVIDEIDGLLSSIGNIIGFTCTIED